MILIPVSVGELVDKITILEIKATEIKDESKLASVRKELALLNAELQKLSISPELSKLMQDLKEVNKSIWDAEEAVRNQGYESEGGKAAAAVSHRENDRRFLIKAEINKLSHSAILEVKSHQR